MVSTYEDDPTTIETLLAMVEHEVRAPLSAIVGFASLIRSDMDQEELDSLVARIRSNAEHLSDVVEAFAGSRPRTGDRPAGLESPQSLHTLVEEIVASNRSIADEKQLGLRIYIDPGVPRSVLCERGKVRVLLQNLISNALKYTDGGEVVVRVQREQHDQSSVRLRYSVEDTGYGIDPGARDSVLEPFVRGDQTSRKPGAGLGLAICARLLEASGSRIEIESNTSGGTVVGFELRHELPDLPTLESTQHVTSSETDLGHRADLIPVLIVDDDDDSLEVLRRLVRREGFVTDVARGGRAALSLVDRRRYSVVMTDLNMSGMSGVELSRRIRESSAQRATSVPTLVAVTASTALRGSAAQDVGELFDDVLLKPVRPRVLSRVLAPHQRLSCPATTHEITEQAPVETAVFQVAPDYPERRLRDVRVLHAFLEGKASIDQVISIGHRISGTADTYGYPRLAELGAALELAGRTGDVARIAWITGSIERLLARTSDAPPGDSGEKQGA